MRLSTLARKIQMNPTRLISILSDMGLHLESGSNTKLDEATVKMVFEKYAPELLSGPSEPEDTDSNEDADLLETSVPEEQEVPILKKWSDELELEIKEPPTKEIIDESKPPEDHSKEEDFEVIKAPKIKLPGLKIKGKIDLPEPRKKPEPEEERVKPVLKVASADKAKRRPDKKSSPNRNKDYNPIEEARKRAEKEKELKKVKQARIRKEKGRERYEREVKSRLQAQNLNKLSLKQEGEPVVEAPEINPPGNIFSKFLRWLNT